MAAAAKTHIAERGGNPEVATVAAFGGAGPVHAYGLAKKLGAPRLIVPPTRPQVAGVASGQMTTGTPASRAAAAAQLA